MNHEEVPEPEYLKESWLSRHPARRDPAALAFGVFFVAFGAFGILQRFGIDLPTRWLIPAVLLGLGVAGLAMILSAERR